MEVYLGVFRVGAKGVDILPQSVGGWRVVPRGSLLQRRDDSGSYDRLLYRDGCAGR